MAFVISAISAIDPQALEFEAEGGVVVYPLRAYEVIIKIDDERLETYGVVWDVEGHEECFIAEEFEDYLRKAFPKKLTDAHLSVLSECIAKRDHREKITFPVVIWD